MKATAFGEKIQPWGVGVGTTQTYLSFPLSYSCSVPHWPKLTRRQRVGGNPGWGRVQNGSAGLREASRILIYQFTRKSESRGMISVFWKSSSGKQEHEEGPQEIKPLLKYACKSPEPTMCIETFIPKRRSQM